MRCTALQSSVPSDTIAGVSVSVKGDTWWVLLLNNRPPVQASCRHTQLCNCMLIMVNVLE